METDNSSTPVSKLNLSLDQVHKRLLKLVEQGHRSAYQIGRLYNYVVDSDLPQQEGFKDARDFFQQKVKVLGQSVLSRNGAVARSFPEEIALKYGMSNLYTLLTYSKLAGLALDHEEPGATPIAVSQEDGSLLTKPFSECTVDELQGAVKYKREPPVPLPEADVSRVQRYRDSLQRHFTEKLSIRVDARSLRGELYISLRNIPEKEMRRLIAALADETASGDARGQGSANQAPLGVSAPPAAQAPNAVLPRPVPNVSAAQPRETAPDEGTVAVPPPAVAPVDAAGPGDASRVPLSPVRDAAPAGNPVVLAPPVTQSASTARTQGTTHHDTPPASEASAAPPRSLAHNDDSPVLPVAGVQPQPSMAPPASPAVRGPAPSGATPLPGAPAGQGQNAPRSPSQGLGGFFRRMTGG